MVFLFLKRSSIKAYNKLTVHRVKTNHNGVAHIEEFPNMKILKKIAHKEHMKFDVIPTKFNVFSILINKDYVMLHQYDQHKLEKLL